MKTLQGVLLRLLVAFVVSLLFFATTTVLALVPGILQTYLHSPGYVVSDLVKPFCELVPLPWFPTVGFCFTFWCMFRESRKLVFSPRVVWFCLFVFLIDAGILILNEVIYAHLLAVNPPPPDAVTIAFNCCMTALGAVIVVLDVITLAHDKKNSLKEANPES